MAVLVNLNLGENSRECVKSEEELLRHIRLIEACTQEQMYGLDFLDRLPCTSFRVYCDQRREDIGAYIFKRQIVEISDSYIRELHQKRKAEVVEQLV